MQRVTPLEDLQIPWHQLKRVDRVSVAVKYGLHTGIIFITGRSQARGIFK